MLKKRLNNMFTQDTEPSSSPAEKPTIVQHETEGVSGITAVLWTELTYILIRIVRQGEQSVA